jgi:hypothetical protein
MSIVTRIEHELHAMRRRADEAASGRCPSARIGPALTLPTDIRGFRFGFPAAQLAELRRRIDATR